MARTDVLVVDANIDMNARSHSQASIPFDVPVIPDYIQLYVHCAVYSELSDSRIDHGR